MLQSCSFNSFGLTKSFLELTPCSTQMANKGRTKTGKKLQWACFPFFLFMILFFFCCDQTPVVDHFFFLE